MVSLETSAIVSIPFIYKNAFAIRNSFVFVDLVVMFVFIIDDIPKVCHKGTVVTRGWEGRKGRGIMARRGRKGKGVLAHSLSSQSDGSFFNCAWFVIVVTGHFGYSPIFTTL